MANSFGGSIKLKGESEYTNALKTMKYYMYLMSFIDTGFSLFLLISSAIIFTIVFIKRINIFLKQISRMKEVFIIAHFEN